MTAGRHGRSDRFVHLTACSDPMQKALVEATLREAGFPFVPIERGASPSVIFGAAGSATVWEFRVSEDDLQTAKDMLCARGIVCDVSERLLRRTLEEVVEPLLSGERRDFDRLVYLVEINNRETVIALFHAILELEGGPALLETLFFELARRGAGKLRSLARVLRAEVGGGFGGRFLFELRGPEEEETRLALLEVLPELPDLPWRREALALGLRDSSVEVREAAAEALFELELPDHGYDPHDPPEDREDAVSRILSE